MRGCTSQGSLRGRRSSAQQATPSREHEPLRPQQPVRPPRRPSVRPGDRGRLLREPRRGRRDQPLPTRERGDSATCTSAPTAIATLVYPVEWAEVSPTHWEVLLRCPNCEWNDVGVFDQATVDRFDERARPRHRGPDARPQAPHRRPTWRTRSSASSARSAPTRSCPRTSESSPRLSAVAVDDAVGHQLQRALLGLRQRRQRRPSPPRPSPAPPRARPPARPVAAIASHTRLGLLRACAPRAGRATASAGSRSRARISGSVTVPSSRSVPRCLPVRSAGPETSSTSSSSWNASPIGRPKRPSTSTGAAARARRARRRPGTAARS